MNYRAKTQEEARFRILRLLQENPVLTQRKLGEQVGMSLGAVNYCLRVLIDRGLVKATNFRRSPNKLGYAYLITPAGIAEMTSLTGRFLSRKLAEYEALRLEIDALSREAATTALRAGPVAGIELEKIAGEHQGENIDPSAKIKYILSER